MALSKHGFETSEKRSALMQKIKSSGTKPELILRKALWSEGIRYRIKNRDIPGNPDIAIRKYKIAVFVDGEFWHGYNWTQKKVKLKNNRKYWIKKIEGNMARDKKVNKTLQEDGWKVLRFWETQLKKGLHSCVSQVVEAIEK